MVTKIFSLFLFATLLFCHGSGPVFAENNSRYLRVALLPVPDVLPVYAARDKGYFAQLAIDIDILPVGSALERDQLMQAGRIDGMINEISGAASFNRFQNRVKIISIARFPIDKSPLFRVLGAPGANLRTVSDLEGIPIGISQNTVIEYITTRLLSSEGMAAEAIVYRSVPVLPERLNLLLSGRLAAVTLPDPLATSAIHQGAVEIINDTALGNLSASVITFSNDSLEKKASAIRDFMVAWDKAVVEINRNPNTFRKILLKNIRVPKNIETDFQVPPFPRKALPTRVQWEDVMTWMVDKKLLDAPLAYEDSVTPEFLPQ
jgi:NitT/TauT family transport system substrate-binding protein